MEDLLKYRVGKYAFEAVNLVRSFDQADRVEVWEEIPEERRQSMYHCIDKVLENPTITGEEMHVEWMNEKLKDGYVYGEVTDREKKTHACLIPYEKLDVLQKLKDDLVIQVVNRYRHDFLNSKYIYLVWYDIIDVDKSSIIDKETTLLSNCLKTISSSTKLLSLHDVTDLIEYVRTDVINKVKNDETIRSYYFIRSYYKNNNSKIDNLKIVLTNLMRLGENENAK